MPLGACKMDIAEGSRGNEHSDGVAEACNIADAADANACKMDIAKLSAECRQSIYIYIAEAAGCMQDGHSDWVAGRWT